MELQKKKKMWNIFAFGCDKKIIYNSKTKNETNWKNNNEKKKIIQHNVWGKYVMLELKFSTKISQPS